MKFSALASLPCVQLLPSNANSSPGLSSALAKSAAPGLDSMRTVAVPVMRVIGTQ